LPESASGERRARARLDVSIFFGEWRPGKGNLEGIGVWRDKT
jgi:hypothetical protein